MVVRYPQKNGALHPDYVCQRRRVESGEPNCQTIVGTPVDRAIGKLLVELVTPLSLEVALAVQDELAAHGDEADRLRRMEVEHMQYEDPLPRRLDEVCDATATVPGLA